MTRYLWILSFFVLTCSSCGWIEQKPQPKPLAPWATLEIHLVTSKADPGALKSIDPTTESEIYLANPPVIDAEDVATVVLTKEDQPGPPALEVTLTPTGAKKLSAATTGAQGKELAIVVNGEVMSIASIHSPMSAGFRITGGALQHDSEEIIKSLTGE